MQRLRAIAQRRRPMRRPQGQRPAHGLSVVELMVGITIGLFILAGASLVVTSQLADNRRLMLETQVQQDLRAASDIILRDVRRAGFHGQAALGVWPQAGATPAYAAANVYAATTPSSANASNTSLVYAYSTDQTNRSIDDNGVVDTDEQFGVRVNPSGSGTLDILIGGTWQALTDANVLEVTDFSVTVNNRTLQVPCAKTCAVGATDCPPQQQVRDVAIVITGQARHDSRVQRSIRGDVRLRNDQLSGVCPT